MILMQLAAGAGVAKAQESATTWDKPREIQAPSTPKPRRKRRATRKIVRRGQQAVEQAPFLTVQYRLLKFKEGAPPVELPAQAVLHPGDLLRLAVTPNQDGFLYIIHQNEGEDGQIVFPDSRVNDGQNFVAKNREFALPPACAPVDSPDCWYKVTPSAKAEFFIVVFSRDQITDLPNQASDRPTRSWGSRAASTPSGSPTSTPKTTRRSSPSSRSSRGSERRAFREEWCDLERELAGG
jgi:hypothetical protein